MTPTHPDQPVTPNERALLDRVAELLHEYPSADEFQWGIARKTILAEYDRLRATEPEGGEGERYVTFKDTGIYVDLQRYFSTPEGKATLDKFDTPSNPLSVRFVMPLELHENTAALVASFAYA